MRLITTIALALLGLTTWAQTSLPDLPTGAQRYSQTLWLVPSDSTLWTGSTGNYAQVATREQLRQLAAQGYTKSQVDSAITSQIGLIDFPVTSVAGKTGDVGLESSDVGLGNVDNTTDLDKPISTATQGALDGKENAFSKGSLVAGTGVTLDGTLSNRLVGSGNVTINSTSSLTASNGLQIISGVISPQYGTLSGTVAQGNDSRINNGQTAFGWGNFRDFGLGTTTNQQLADFTPVDASYLTRVVGVHGDFFGINNTERPRGFLYKGTVDSRWSWMGVTDQGALRAYIANSSNRTSETVAELWHSGNLTPPVSFTRTVSGLVPSPGGSGTTRYLREDGSWVDPSSGGGGGTATDLSIANRNANTLQIGSSTGTNATIPAATTSLSGLMTASDKTTLSNAITSESDPTVPSHVKAITSGQISNWNTSYGWGDYRDFGLGTATNGPLSDFTPVDASYLTRVVGVHGDFFGINNTHRPRGFLYKGTTADRWSWMGVTDQGELRAYIANSLNRTSETVAELWHSGNFTPSDYLLTSNFTWSNLSGKPSTFAPSPHSHSAADINSGTLAAARIGNATVSNAKLANMSANTIKGRSGSTGAPQDLTAAQARTILNVAETGTGASQTRTNSQLDGRYVQLTGSQSISGTKTFNSPVVAPQYQGTSTTASLSIPTNTHTLFKASISSNTSYTLTNMSGNPRHIQVMVTNTSSSDIGVYFFNANMSTTSQNPTVSGNSTVIFTFLVENGTAWGTKTTF